MQYLYHLTTENKIVDILTYGLHPVLGSNSKSVGEVESFVYLTSWEDLPIWKLILNRDVCFGVNVEGIDSIFTDDYGFYKEYYTQQPLCDVQLITGGLPKISKQQIQNLYVGYAHTLSCLLTQFARYYTENRGELKYMIATSVNCIDIMNRLSKYEMDRSNVIEHIRELGEEGDYTLCDTYMSTGRRLWEQLSEYPVDESMDTRLQLKSAIEKTYEGCLYVNTGGYCG